MALARPSWVERGEALTVTVISDVSRSIPLEQRVQASTLVQQLIREKERPEDQVAGVSLAAGAQPTAKPHPETIVDLDAFEGPRTATDLGAGVEQALLAPSIEHRESTAPRLRRESDPGKSSRGDRTRPCERDPDRRDPAPLRIRERGADRVREGSHPGPTRSDRRSPDLPAASSRPRDGFR